MRGYARAAVVVVVGACAGGSTSAGPDTFDPRDAFGIYVLAASRSSRDWAGLVRESGVTGVSLNATWDELEPEPGQYRWKELDERIRLATSADKKVALRVLAGISTPDWVYERGARAFRFVDQNPFHTAENYPEGHRNQSFGEDLRIPVPWDEPFLAAWESFVKAFGAHLRSTPVAMVHVTGPNKHSAEMILPKDPNDREQWKRLDYEPQKLERAWARSINAFAQAFPRSAIVLNLSPAIFPDGVPERVVKTALERHGRRLFLQNNILQAGGERRREDWGILERYAARTTVGFQRQPLRLRGQRMEKAQQLRARRDNFEGMLEEGLARQARYFEVGIAEVRDFPEIVRKVAAQLR